MSNELLSNRYFKLQNGEITILSLGLINWLSSRWRLNYLWIIIMRRLIKLKCQGCDYEFYGCVYVNVEIGQ